MSAGAPPLSFVLVRPGELALKGGNRSRFEKILRRNLRAALARAGFGAVGLERRHGRIYLGPSDRAGDLARCAAEVFGVAGTSPAARIASEPDAIRAAVPPFLAARFGPGRLEGRSFAVRVRRADKLFPEHSTPFAAELGALVLERFPGLRVDLGAPDIELGVEIREEGTFLYAERIKGAGGLPVGSEGRVLALLSGGIDSPVAAWLAMKRGCRTELLHFDARPFTGPGSLDKVRRLAARLDRWQGGTILHVCPFAEIQKAIAGLPKEGYRTVLYRRFMMRIAERLARRRRALAVVTGDSLGQVASQTLKNLAVVHAAAAAVPVLRPLAGFDKEETVALARRIGTYETSIEPFDDCCTLFQPKQPVTGGDPETAARLEETLDVEALVAGALAGTEEEAIG